MPQWYFKLGDVFLNIKSYITSMFFERYMVPVWIQAVLYIIHTQPFLFNWEYNMAV
jgi:hypothetical protein